MARYFNNVAGIDAKIVALSKQFLGLYAELKGAHSTEVYLTADPV